MDLAPKNSVVRDNPSGRFTGRDLFRLASLDREVDQCGKHQEQTEELADRT